MKDVKNQHQQVLWYLINWDKFSLLDVVKDSVFIKFQTRLSDIELQHGSITKKTKKGFINRFGRASEYNLYECIDKQKAINLMKKY